MQIYESNKRDSDSTANIWKQTKNIVSGEHADRISTIAAYGNFNKKDAALLISFY
jgi:hypothetical protein